MTPLFGPLATVGAYYGYPQPYGSSPIYSNVRTAMPPWWRAVEDYRAGRPKLPNGSPISPAPPVKNIDTPTGVPSFGPPPAAALVGTQRTRPDHLFGPFAKLGTTSMSYGPGMLGGAPFPNF